MHLCKIEKIAITVVNIAAYFESYREALEEVGMSVGDFNRSVSVGLT